ncbi:hypothetical protein [Rhodoplanes serenus]|uniref:hypothetical protein n=1 Tax=Rhodoplanes serenus TaxID=200615 RepID=UPI000DAF1805|nr:hypothetical protein [Rhodoplanes serenus]RAI28433.1 hypothetical protein CH340_23600 [Rhodoplanes serenus]
MRGGTTRAASALDAGLGQTIGALDAGYGRTMGEYDAALGSYASLDALGAKYGGATSLLLDALGANGADGAARAKTAFTTGPGYQFAVDQATEAAARKAASLGMAASGNTMAAISDRAQGLASQEWGSYLDRLGGFLNPELSARTTAATGRAGVYGNRAAASAADTAARAGAYSSDATARAGLYSGEGNTLGGLYTGDATGRAGIYGQTALNKSNVAGNVASGTANSNTAAANAQMQASSNFWSGLMNLAGSFAPKPKAG